MATKGLSFDKQFQDALERYAQKYDVESLESPNDKANLHTMIRNQIVIDELQRKMHDLAGSDAISNAVNIKKLGDMLGDLIDRNIVLEKQLGIDRKTRQQEQSESHVEYILKLKSLAKEFLDKRLLKIYCKNCQIMVGRISGVYDTTEYFAAFQCPQCKKSITVTRKERDIFYDLKPNDREWRRKYPIEIIQAKRNKGAPVLDDTEDDLILDDISSGVEFDEDGN